jgi:hypothetical protein
MVTTKFDRDGSCFREIYAKGDSAFLSGNLSHNPYMFNLDSDWHITTLDIAEKQQKYNVKISKTVGAVEEFSTGLQFDKDIRPLAAPTETFQKSFKWFYTYYTFKTVYPCISEKIPVAIDEYMTENEQKLWFQGDFSAYLGMTGLELKDKMDNIENQFMSWYYRNVYEVYFNVVYNFEKLSENSPYLTLLPAAKDTVFRILEPEMDLFDDIEHINHTLDIYFKTTHFSDSYKVNEQQFDRMCEKYLLEDLFSKEIEYQLIVPGKLINANTFSVYRDTLTWKITALRLIPGDCELTATSRTVNIWAFAVVFFLIVLSGYCFLKLRTKS